MCLVAVAFADPVLLAAFFDKLTHAFVVKGVHNEFATAKRSSSSSTSSSSSPTSAIYWQHEYESVECQGQLCEVRLTVEDLLSPSGAGSVARPRRNNSRGCGGLSGADAEEGRALRARGRGVFALPLLLLCGKEELLFSKKIMRIINPFFCSAPTVRFLFFGSPQRMLLPQSFGVRQNNK